MPTRMWLTVAALWTRIAALAPAQHKPWTRSITAGRVANALVGAWKEKTVRTVTCKVEYRGCRSETFTDEQSDKVNNLSGAGGVVTGQVAGRPDALSGSQLIPFGFPGPTKHQAAATWSLTR